MEAFTEEQGCQSAGPRVTGRVRVDKVASVTVRLEVPQEVVVGVPSRLGVGDVVVVRVLRENPNYDVVELTNGRLAQITPGDLLVGVLGGRRALKGFTGEVPRRLRPGDRLHLLNMGGVIGLGTGAHHSLGAAPEVEYVGAVMEGSQVLNLAQAALPPVSSLREAPPVVLVAGTCMNSGKTKVATQLIQGLTRRGLRVAAGKLSGVACLRDTLNMLDHGAIQTLSFLDCGLPSTVGLPHLRWVARTLVFHLTQSDPDLVVLELGDGILGEYCVDTLFEDREFLRFCCCLIFCAGDFVGAWGGVQWLRQRGVEVDLISGSVTDTVMGVEYLRRELGIPALNALQSAARLAAEVEERLRGWKGSE